MTDRGQPRPFAWVPTLYFAEGIPFFAVSLIAGILYKRLGLSNDVIALYTKLLLLPWSLKPLWSPLLEMFKTKKYFVVLLQLSGGAGLGLIALCLQMCIRDRVEATRVGMDAFVNQALIPDKNLLRPKMCIRDRD